MKRSVIHCTGLLSERQSLPVTIVKEEFLSFIDVFDGNKTNSHSASCYQRRIEFHIGPSCCMINVPPNGIGMEGWVEITPMCL